jgi:flagellar basal body-associated protein FliL
VAEPATPGAEEEAPKKKKPPLLLVAGALVLCAGVGSLVYFLAPPSLFSPDAKAHASGGAESHGAKERHGAASKHADTSHDAVKSGADGEGDAAKFRLVGERGIYLPEPLVISIRPAGSARYLKLGYAVETDPNSEALFIEHELHIKDALNFYLRSVDIASLEDPAVMHRIRAQIGRRITLIVQPAPVHAVLITDFILS